MRSRKLFGLTLSSVALVMLAVTFVDAGIEISGLIHTDGTINTIGVNIWWNENNTDPCMSIDWGDSIDPNTTMTRTVYVENPGNTPITVSLLTTNWSPSQLADYSSFTWDRESVTIEPRLTLETTFTFTIHSNVSETMIEAFSFDIIIAGSS